MSKNVPHKIGDRTYCSNCNVVATRVDSYQYGNNYCRTCGIKFDWEAVDNGEKDNE